MRETQKQIHRSERRKLQRKNELVVDLNDACMHAQVSNKLSSDSECCDWQGPQIYAKQNTKNANTETSIDPVIKLKNSKFPKEGRNPELKIRKTVRLVFARQEKAPETNLPEAKAWKKAGRETKTASKNWKKRQKREMDAQMHTKPLTVT